MGIDVNKMVTDRIIEQMENGIIPWVKPWKEMPYGGRVYNRSSKRAYRGINRLLLKHDGEYDTFDGWKKAGGKIRKGEKSEIVVFYKIVEKTNADREKETFPYLRYYNVFHISQVDGVEPLPKKELEEVNGIESADEVINGYISRSGIGFHEIISNEAFYSPLTDSVTVPVKGQYKNVNEYYSTTFHELTHSTGHKSRLDRLNAVTRFGSESYSKEELIAEIGACTILNILGLETENTFRNSTAYLQNWLSVLKNDTKMIVSASGKAEKAVELILG